jgi:hypothetical protein
MSSQSIFAALLGIMFALAGGLVLSKPHVFQRWALKRYETRWNPFLKFMRSRDYVLSLRVCGLILLGMAGIVLWSAFQE